MNETSQNQPATSESLTQEEMNRRRFFARLSVSLGGLCATILAVPVLGFVLAPLFRKTPEDWIKVGKVDDFKIGATVKVPYPDPSPLPWAGVTANSAAWLRRDGENAFTAFSIHCTHMGCPVRWVAESKLFMCPCHGGVFYPDGSVAAGPPPKPLVRYPVQVANGQVEIKAVPTPITTQL
jgi:menaquinol-cytochrome c reductase iron-sulfur subunit